MPENDINPNVESLKSIVVDEIEKEILEEEIEELSANKSNESEENKELTDEEKREIFIQNLKNSKKTYFPKKNFGVAYKKTRNKKNRISNKSRKANRK